MTRRALWVALGLALACGVTEEQPSVEPETEVETPDATPTDRDAPVADRDATPMDRDAPVAGELPQAEPVVAQIFDERAEPEGPRRVTYHVLLARDATRDQLRETLSRVMAGEAERDSSLVAARTIGYYGVQTSATEAEMVAFVWAEWLPVEGWYGATEQSRESLHRLYFYPETPPQW